MSDTLRTALEELAAKWELAGFPSKATELRAQLAAHPADAETETQWGVRWNGEDEVTEYQPSDKATVVSAFKADIAWAKRNAIKTPPKGELVSRQVTTWEAAK